MTNGTLRHGGYLLGVGGIAASAHEGLPRGHPGFFNRTFLQRNCSAVSAACFAVRATMFSAARRIRRRQSQASLSRHRFLSAGAGARSADRLDALRESSRSRLRRTVPRPSRKTRNTCASAGARSCERDPFYSPSLVPGAAARSSWLSRRAGSTTRQLRSLRTLLLSRRILRFLRVTELSNLLPIDSEDGGAGLVLTRADRRSDP